MVNSLAVETLNASTNISLFFDTLIFLTASDAFKKTGTSSCNDAKSNIVM